MNKTRSIAVSLSTVLMLAFLVSVFLPASACKVYADIYDNTVEVTTSDELKEALSDSSNIGRIIYLSKDIVCSSDCYVYYPMTLCLNGRRLSFDNGYQLYVKLNSDSDVFNILGKLFLDGYRGVLVGNINGSLVYLEKGTVVVEDIEVYNKNTNYNGSAFNSNSNIILNSGLFSCHKGLISDIRLNSYVREGAKITDSYINMEAQLIAGGRVVSNYNCNDVLGDGVFSYDNSSKTLTINGDCSNYIISYIEDLVINVTKDSVCHFVQMDLHGTTTITGGHKLSFIECMDFCITCCENNKDIIVKDISLFFGYSGAAFYGLGKDSGQNLILDNVEVITKYLFFEGNKSLSTITLKNCEITDTDGYIIKDGLIYESDGTTKAREVTIKANDYWEPVEYTWSDDYSECTAKRVSKVDASKIETETVTTTSKVKTVATTSEKGTTTYTATFLNEGFSTQTKDVQNIPVIVSDPVKDPITDPIIDPVADPSFEDFVERLYVVALNRPSEPEGKAFWCEHVGNGDLNGAQCANEFLLSKEFNDRGLSDEEFLKVLYKTFFDRDAAADPDGFNFWMNSLKTEGRDKVVDGFINSEEWCNICATYGVKSGATRAKATIPSKNAKEFAERLYTKCLGRDAEEEGLMFWALGLTNLELTGKQAAHEFFFSKEFNDHNFDNKELLTRMYRTFMGREPDDDGMNFWLDSMKNGMTKDQVFDEFVKSPEFTQICKDYAIDRG
ncbi:MAG: DUF4214 domain-containing protein [Clostridiales bacterium]|nr:DUF4214 domain-containing protein [Clostridiales bacterium]